MLHCLRHPDESCWIYSFLGSYSSGTIFIKVTRFSCIGIHEMHVWHFCICVIICHCHQNTIYHTDQLTECKTLTGACLCMVQDSILVYNQKEANGMLDKLLPSNILKFKRPTALKCGRSRHIVHINFFHCFSVWKHIPEPGNFFFIQPVYTRIRLDLLGNKLRMGIFYSESSAH
jgi:hypothetical protein